MSFGIKRVPPLLMQGQPAVRLMHFAKHSPVAGFSDNVACSSCDQMIFLAFYFLSIVMAQLLQVEIGIKPAFD